MKHYKILAFCLSAVLCMNLFSCKNNDEGKNMGEGFNVIDLENQEKVITKATFEVAKNAEEKDGIFTPSSLIQNGMVLQRNAVNCIFGKTTQPAVAVRIDNNIYYGTVADGEFKVYIPAHKEGGAYSLEIIGNEGKKTITDVYFGEVFLLSGQSNMAWSMGSSLNGDFGMHTGKYVPTAKDDPLTYQSYVADSFDRNEMIKNYVLDQIEGMDNNLLRVFRIGVQPDNSPVYDTLVNLDSVEGSWKTANYENMVDFSAVGCAFGARLQELINIPVGLVSAALGATFVPTWTPFDVYNANKESFVYGGDNTDKSYNKAARCYGRYINPIAGYKFRSAVWYQGEGQPSKYADSMVKLIDGWRSEFGYELPFLIVQLPRFGENDTLPENYTSLGLNAPSLSLTPFNSREEQKKIAEQLEKCAYSVNVDLGDYDELHPYDKKTVGERLAGKVMEYFYKTEGVWSGAKFKSAEKTTDGVNVIFDNVGGGIKLINDGINIEAAGSDGVYYPASASVVSNNTLKVTCLNVAEIKYVRYGANNYPRITRNDVSQYMSLFTAEGFPVEQFVTLVG